MTVEDFLNVIHSTVGWYVVSDERGDAIFRFAEQEIDKVPEKVLKYNVSSIELFEDSHWEISVETEA